ncbi:acylneuraminate cytidylyltransferase family protein [Catenovulum sediminis]|uniref:Acylneuraminate cytidylyltransferase family protein n=1 Tax=Catenovulum sediminis TaxID=1740262 RepID=A0ABV1RGX1_9ALTE
MNDVIAIIPARSGSKSIPDKNIALLAGYPLIAFSIIAAKLSKKIQRVIVSTDSSEYAEIARSYGAETPFIRPKEYARDESTDRAFLLHAINWFEENEAKCPEYWVHLRPTTPLRVPSLIDQAVEALMDCQQATSLRSAHKAPESPLKWFSKSEDGFFNGLMPKTFGVEGFNLPKEQFEDIFIPDGYIDVIKKSHILNSQSIHGRNILAFESPVCSEVDSKEEFEYIEFQIQKHGSEILEYLKANY